jgi:type II secretory pathway pseudopilin PulG
MNIRVHPKSGFTLVDLLMLIAIIGILSALLFPAVQSIRESARQSQCANHVRRISLAALEHVEVQGYFPTAFGGAHSSGFRVSFCDGSVRELSFDIDPNIHRFLGDRADGQAIDLSKL